MTIYVGSLQYSPVYKSHCCSFGKACEQKGYHVKYLFNYEYNWLLPDEVKKKTIFIGHSKDIPSMVRDILNINNFKRISQIFFEDSPTHFYMHNYHMLNHYIAKKAKENRCQFIYHVHEPYVPNKKAHGGLQQYWLYLSDFFQKELIEHANKSVVSSELASQYFDFRFNSCINKKFLIPLMYEDLGSLNTHSKKREYVTFIGPPLPAKNPEKFLEIVKALENHSDINFLLISRLMITDKHFYGYKNLKIYYKDKISDEEFGDLLKQSIAVITPYKRETQSSVILVSYMYGTPVISSNIGGLPEFVFHKKTGYLVDVNANIETWIQGINYIRQNFDNLSFNCRNYFENNFSGKNWEKYLVKLLN